MRHDQACLYNFKIPKGSAGLPGPIGVKKAQNKALSHFQKLFLNTLFLNVFLPANQFAGFFYKQ